MSTDQKIIKNKVGLLKLAEMLGSVAQACKRMATGGIASIASRSCRRKAVSWRCRKSAAASRVRRTASKRPSRKQWWSWPWRSRPTDK
jgi:hypothetical protein